MSNFLSNNEKYMKRCLELAARAAGRTSPNPLVGSVIVDDAGNIIAEGHHHRAGQAHAEINALNNAHNLARNKTLYVNLEPCSHHGRTGPCCEQIIASGIRKVVCGMRDPNPKVAGAGVKALEQAGIEVITDVLEDECRYLNRAFLKWIVRGKPWLSLKMAATLDGRIADRHGQSRWISGAAARELVHEMRDSYDCVMIGGATALLDDPELTVRGRDSSRNPLRAILDTNLDLDPGLRLFKNDDETNTVLFARQQAVKENQKKYSASTKIVAVSDSNDHLNLPGIMSWLGEQQVLSVLCEGGSHLAASLLQEQLVDELFWIVAPKILCDREAVPSLSGLNFVSLDQATNFITRDVVRLGNDVLIHGLITQP